MFMLSFLPEFFLGIYISTAIFVKKLYQKNIVNYYVYPASMLLIFFSDKSYKMDLFAFSSYESLVKIVILFAAFVVSKCIEKDNFNRQLLMALSIIGCMLSISSCDLVSLFFSLELAIIPTYALVFQKTKDVEQPSVLYFLYGITASAIFVSAITLIYLSIGVTNFSDIRHVLSFTQNDQFISIALALIIISFCIRLPSLLCHGWLLDTGERNMFRDAAIFTSTRITIFFVIYKILTLVLCQINIKHMVLLIASLSALGGSVCALKQTSIKKMMCYVLVYHGGIVLMCSEAHSYSGTKSLIFFAISELISILSFIIFISIIKKNFNQELTDISDLKGLSSFNKPIAVSFSTSMISFAGVPPLIGFCGKFFNNLCVMENFSPFVSAIFLIAMFLCMINAMRIFSAIWFDEKTVKFALHNEQSINMLHLLAWLTILAIPFANKMYSFAKMGIYFAS